MNKLIGDYDVWYKKCEHCGYDTGRSTTPKNGNKTCWKCGNFVQRDYSDRALKKDLKTPQKMNESSENLNISDLIEGFDDFDQQNYEIAKIIFLKEEGREPNMNITEEMNLVAAIEVGVRYARNYLDRAL